MSVVSIGPVEATKKAFGEAFLGAALTFIISRTDNRARDVLDQEYLGHKGWKYSHALLYFLWAYHGLFSLEDLVWVGIGWETIEFIIGKVLNEKGYWNPDIKYAIGDVAFNVTGATLGFLARRS